MGLLIGGRSLLRLPTPAPASTATLGLLLYRLLPRVDARLPASEPLFLRLESACTSDWWSLMMVVMALNSEITG